MLEHEGSDFLLCTLVDRTIYQQALDLNFNDGENVTFYLKGKGTMVKKLFSMIVSVFCFRMSREL